jgi:hypothetical protein
MRAASESRILRWISDSSACFRSSSERAISGVKAGPYTSRYVFSSPAVASATSPIVIASPATLAATSRPLSLYVPIPHHTKVRAMKRSTNLMAQEPALRRSRSSMAVSVLLFDGGNVSCRTCYLNAAAWRIST